MLSNVAKIQELQLLLDTLFIFVHTTAYFREPTPLELRKSAYQAAQLQEQATKPNNKTF